MQICFQVHSGGVRSIAHKCLDKENNSDFGQLRFKECAQIKDFTEQGNICVSATWQRKQRRCLELFKSFVSSAAIGKPAVMHLSKEKERPEELLIFGIKK